MDLALDTQEWLGRLSEAVRGLRLAKNLSQAELAHRAGVGRSALQSLESTGHGTLTTLVRVVRALGREDWLASLAATATINPLHLVRQTRSRQRASRRRRGDQKT